MMIVLSRRTRVAIGPLWLFALLLFSGCGSKGSDSSSITIDPPLISVQPASQIVLPGQTATFSVTATSDRPLTYDWYEDGNVIPQATGASYITPPAAPGANGSNLVGTFWVVVNDGNTFVTSQKATLEIGPRSPRPGDLRYLLLQQVPQSDLGAYTSCSPGPTGDCGMDNALGTPIAMGSYGYAWEDWAQYLINPSGYSMHYQPGAYSGLASDLQSLSTPDAVVTSLGFAPPNSVQNSGSIYYASWVQNLQASGFDWRLDPVIPSGTNRQSQIQAQATLDGAQSRIVTALFFDASGAANLLSYGWTGDNTTTYEAQTIQVSPGSNVITALATAATTLANEGYFISAFGGDDINGYVLVGMRVAGDSYARAIEMESFELGVTTTTTPVNPTFANFTVVAWLQESGQYVEIFEQ